MRKSSRTAISVAAFRAAHQLVDAEPRVLDDPVILRLLGIETLDTIREDRHRYQTPGARALRAHVVMRTRYAEDRLAQAVARGVRQYVILGAGLETFAYRQPAWARGLRIVELDRAPMQREKRERLMLAQVEVPENVSFGAVDFESESLNEVLETYGIDTRQPTFFSCLGVTMYLSELAVTNVLGVVAGSPRGSEIVFTFAPASSAGGVVDDGMAVSPSSRPQRVSHGGLTSMRMSCRNDYVHSASAVWSCSIPTKRQCGTSRRERTSCHHHADARSSARRYRRGASECIGDDESRRQAAPCQNWMFREFRDRDSVGVVTDTTDTALKPLTGSVRRVIRSRSLVSGISASSAVSAAPRRKVHVRVLSLLGSPGEDTSDPCTEIQCLPELPEESNLELMALASLLGFRSTVTPEYRSAARFGRRGGGARSRRRLGATRAGTHRATHRRSLPSARTPRAGARRHPPCHGE